MNSFFLDFTLLSFPNDLLIYISISFALSLYYVRNKRYKLYRLFYLTCMGFLLFSSSVSLLDNLIEQFARSYFDYSEIFKLALLAIFFISASLIYVSILINSTNSILLIKKSVKPLSKFFAILILIVIEIMSIKEVILYLIGNSTIRAYIFSLLLFFAIVFGYILFYLIRKYLIKFCKQKKFNSKY